MKTKRRDKERSDSESSEDAPVKKQNKSRWEEVSPSNRKSEHAESRAKHSEDGRRRRSSPTDVETQRQRNHRHENSDYHHRNHHRQHREVLRSHDDGVSEKRSRSHRERYHGNDGHSHERRNNREERESRYEPDERSRHGRGDRDREQQHDGRRRPGGRVDKGRRGRRSRSRSFDHSKATWGKSDEASQNAEKKPPTEKEKPNFGLSGKLTEETNTYRGVVIKYSEPPEARKPKRRWRLYPFKGEKAMQTLYIHRESAYLIGRDRKIVDIPVDHPSCSKQHAALQYRLVPFTRDDGSSGKRVRPYIIDLESANGTFLNNKKIDPKRYVELIEKDVLKFGFSTREYVMLHENSKDEAQDDDVKPEDQEPESTAIATATVKNEDSDG